jgi:hypothetical protein
MTTASAASPVAKPSTALGILCALSVGHLLNDTVQSLLPALYPLLKESLNLTFTQIGLITLAFQLTASLLQPVVGLFTDRHPQPYSLAAGMVLSLVGLLLLAFATTFPAVLIAGGDGKGADFGDLAETLARTARAVVLIGRDAPLIEAVHLMVIHHVVNLPVMRGNDLVGIIREKEIIAEITGKIGV